MNKLKDVVAPTKATVQDKFPDIPPHVADIIYKIMRLCGDIEFAMFPNIPIILLLIAAEYVEDRGDFIDQIEQRLRHPEYWTH